MTTTIENPASPAAVALGCTCCADTNRNGGGEPINDGFNRRYVVRLYCPVHSSWRKPE